jgi:polysaccharide pyruvyl transferase WcaK-like protein
VSFLGDLAKGLGRKALGGVRAAADPDRAVGAAMSALIDEAARRHRRDPSPPWRPGEPLRLLLAGYVGTRNTGADVRVEEMVAQLRHLFGDEHLDLSISTTDPALTRGYFKTVKQLEIPQVFHRFLYDTVRTQHGVIACEGSMFKSKFANALSVMMVGAIGLAAAEEKLAVGYGGEAGTMDEALEALVRKHCRDALIIARTEPSRRVLDGLGLRTEQGTDTAWTFEAAPEERGRQLLMRGGWDGQAPVLVLCPIHPFWWPVKPEPLKAAAHAATGAYDARHYRSLYFHAGGKEVEDRFHRYLHALAAAAEDHCRETGAFLALVGMEQLDRRACDQLKGHLHRLDPPLYVSDEHRMHDLVSVLRQARVVVSSRYHAMVCSMPASVPSIGVTMDERIRNLCAERGQPELALEVDDDELEGKLLEALRRVDAERDAIVDGIERCVLRNVRRMGEMGAVLVDHVRESHPEFPFRDGLGRRGDPLDHLPPLGPTVRRLAEAHGGFTG